MTLNDALLDKSSAEGQAGATETSPVIRVESLKLGYGRIPTLSDVTLDIQQGEFWCLLGPNGEGKTTFIKAILGALRPMMGRISLRVDFNNRTRLAFVPQECEVNSTAPMTAVEFVSCGFVGLKLNPRTRTNRLNTVLELLGVSHLRKRNFWTLSGGQRQRMLIARALVRDPLLLIVDEPTAGLDLAASSGLIEIISDLNKNKHITVLFVTHDLNIAAQRASHVAFFRKGRVTSGRIEEVFRTNALSETFGVEIEVRWNGDRPESVIAHTPKLAST